MKKALFVIDIQEDFTGDTAHKKPFLIRRSKELIEKINKYIELYTKKEDEIIYIAEVFPNNWFGKTYFGMALAGTEGSKIGKRIKILSNNNFEKLFPSDFTNKDLCKFIKNKKISHVELTGIDLIQCLAATAYSAAKLGLEVTILSNAAATVLPKRLPRVIKKLKAVDVKYIE